MKKVRFIACILFVIFSDLSYPQNAKTANYHNDMAIDELMLGNNQTALYEINQALKINPKNANYYYIRGVILQKMKESQNNGSNYYSNEM